MRRVASLFQLTVASRRALSSPPAHSVPRARGWRGALVGEVVVDGVTGTGRVEERTGARLKTSTGQGLLKVLRVGPGQATAKDLLRAFFF